MLKNYNSCLYFNCTALLCMRFGNQVAALARISCMLPALHLCRHCPEKLPSQSCGALNYSCCSQHSGMGWAWASTDLNKHLADPPCTFPTRVGLDQTTAVLLLISHDTLINGWLPETLSGMKGGPGYPKTKVGHATFNKIIMNIPRSILPIRRNPSLTIYFTEFTFLENAAAVKGWCFL